MGMTSEVASNTAAAYGVQENRQTEKKSSVRGKTIGQPKLSEKAQKYYDELKRKYSGMDFILVSSDMKDAVQANAGKYASMSSSQTVVLIDEEKIERMREDAESRNALCVAGKQFQGPEGAYGETGGEKGGAEKRG